MRMLAAMLAVALSSACERAGRRTPEAAIERAGGGGGPADNAGASHRQAAYRDRPGYVIDSIFTVQEEIRRFVANLDTVTHLTGGAASRTQLVRSFARALARRDTAALRRLLVRRDEFAYLLFPESPFTRPPYETKPLLLWMQLVRESEKGLSRTLERYGGVDSLILTSPCRVSVEQHGASRYWRKCTVLVRESSGVVRRRRLFGVIVQRDGRFKFLSYDSDL